MHQLQISLHRRGFISIIQSQAPVVLFASDDVACAEALLSQVYTAVFSEVLSVTHNHLCPVNLLTNVMASPFFPQKKIAKSALPPPIVL